MSTVTQERKTELVKQAPFTISPITYPAQAEAIQKLADEYLPLTVKSVDDKAGIEVVHAARMKVRNLRLAIESRRKELKASALEYGREVDTAARTLCELIDPIEQHLLKEESIVAREKARLAAEEEKRQQELAEQRQATTRERLAKLQLCGKAYMPEDVANLPEDEFEALHAAELKAKQARDDQAAADAAERERIAAEQKAEAERLAELQADLEAKRVAAETRNKCAMARMELLSRLGHAHEMTGEQLADMAPDHWEDVLASARMGKQQRDDAARAEADRLDAQRAEQQAAQAKIDAENKRIADEAAERIHREAVAKAAAEAAEQAKADAIAEQARIAAAEKEHAEAAAAEQQRQEELRPDREKIAIFADSIQGMFGPRLSPKAKEVSAEIGQALLACSKAIRAAGSKLK